MATALQAFQDGTRACQGLIERVKASDVRSDVEFSARQSDARQIESPGESKDAVAPTRDCCFRSDKKDAEGDPSLVVGATDVQVNRREERTSISSLFRDPVPDLPASDLTAKSDRRPLTVPAHFRPPDCLQENRFFRSSSLYRVMTMCLFQYFSMVFALFQVFKLN